MTPSLGARQSSDCASLRANVFFPTPGRSGEEIGVRESLGCQRVEIALWAFALRRRRTAARSRTRTFTARALLATLVPAARSGGKRAVEHPMARRSRQARDSRAARARGTRSFSLSTRSSASIARCRRARARPTGTSTSSTRSGSSPSVAVVAQRRERREIETAAVSLIRQRRIHEAIAEHEPPASSAGRITSRHVLGACGVDEKASVSGSIAIVAIEERSRESHRRAAFRPARASRAPRALRPLSAPPSPIAACSCRCPRSLQYNKHESTSRDPSAGVVNALRAMDGSAESAQPSADARGKWPRAVCIPTKSTTHTRRSF